MSVFCYASRRLVSFIGTWEDSEGWGFTKISEGSKHPEIACGGTATHGKFDNYFTTNRNSRT
ncbi:hypothetical protein DRQ00_10530 [candidate division KSB1 bacterium]|nr:MAG: hypothetical protein DRQ00_10530 [candidate division KSB1 bacterium]RKY88603.1 MAG: hypothetical protein DRQ11_03270 [candidate division KSB1 bacterium]